MSGWSPKKLSLSNFVVTLLTHDAPLVPAPGCGAGGCDLFKRRGRCALSRNVQHGAHDHRIGNFKCKVFLRSSAEPVVHKGGGKEERDNNVHPSTAAGLHRSESERQGRLGACELGPRWWLDRATHKVFIAGGQRKCASEGGGARVAGRGTPLTPKHLLRTAN